VEQRYCIKFCQKLRDSKAETIQKIQQAFSELLVQWISLMVGNGMLECNWESANRHYETAQTHLTQSKTKEVLRELHSRISGDHLDVYKP
jgi:hypothetical protein